MGRRRRTKNNKIRRALRFCKGRQKPLQPCALCNRTTFKTTVHHLAPKSTSLHKERMREGNVEKVSLCQACHRQIHIIFPNKILEKNYNKWSLLRNHPEVVKFADFIRHKPINYNPKMREMKRDLL